MITRGSRIAVLASCLSLAFACGGKKEAKEPEKLGDSPGAVTVPEVDASLCDTEGKRVSTFDLNRDGRPDVWKLYATVEEGGTTTEVMTCKQVDFDHDGVKDYVVTYKETGEMITEEIDLGFDQRFDSRHHFDPESNEVYLVERDTDFDKDPDVWEKYTPEGVIDSVRRDTNGDGKPDVWEQYVEGKLVAILFDDDFDNRVDRKEQVAVDKKKTTSSEEAGSEEPEPEPPVTEGTGEPEEESDSDAGDGDEGSGAGAGG